MENNKFEATVEKITVKWLIDNIPVSWWTAIIGALIGIIALSFSLGASNFLPKVFKISEYSQEIKNKKEEIATLKRSADNLKTKIAYIDNQKKELQENNTILNEQNEILAKEILYFEASIFKSLELFSLDGKEVVIYNNISLTDIGVFDRGLFVAGKDENKNNIAKIFSYKTTTDIDEILSDFLTAKSLGHKVGLICDIQTRLAIGVLYGEKNSSKKKVSTFETDPANLAESFWRLEKNTTFLRNCKIDKFYQVDGVFTVSFHNENNPNLSYKVSEENLDHIKAILLTAKSLEKNINLIVTNNNPIITGAIIL